MKSIIEQLFEQAEVPIQYEVSDWTQSYHMLQGGSPETEVLEFLYGLVKVVKPKNILETGTYAGWSSAVMAKAMETGKLTTLEIDEYWVKQAEQLHQKLGLTNIERRHQKSLEYEPDRKFEIMFLDSEPDIRFKELVRFCPSLLPDGFIIIHDLHPHLGLSNQTLHNMEHWPFGDFRPYFGNLIKNHQLQVVNFHTPRGLTLFYHPDTSNSSYKLLNGEL